MAMFGKFIVYKRLVFHGDIEVPEGTIVMWEESKKWIDQNMAKH